MPLAHASPVKPSLLSLLCGATAVAALWRAVLLFGLGDVLPRLSGRQPASLMHAALLLGAYALLALAIFRRLQAEPQSAGDEFAALSDAAATPSTLDALVDLAGQPQEKPREWSLELLHALEWKRMGDVCLAFYKERELSARNVTVGSDGSMDATLHQGGEEAPFALLHCKARAEQEVGAAALEGVLQFMQEAGVARAFFMGAWSFSAEAKQLAAAHQITLVDDRMFLALLARLPHADSQRLLNLAVEGDYTTPSCPGCLLKMIPRQNEQGRYWGCRAYPHCKHTLGMQA
jgi:restriction system protein